MNMSLTVILSAYNMDETGVPLSRPPKVIAKTMTKVFHFWLGKCALLEFLLLMTTMTYAAYLPAYLPLLYYQQLGSLVVCKFLLIWSLCTLHSIGTQLVQ